MFSLLSIATILFKWLLYVGILGAAGTVFCVLLFKINNYRSLVYGFILIALFASIVSFMLKGVALTGEITGMIDTEMLSLLWSTSSGAALRFQIIGLAILLTGLFLGKLGIFISSIGGMVALWSFVIIGHIPDQENWMLTVGLLFHLTIAAVWIGILIPLKRLALDPDHLAQATKLGHNFGQVAKVLIPVLILAGIYMAYALLGSISAIFSTNYGIILLLKVVLVVTLLGMAAINKYRFIPSMQKGEAMSSQLLARSIKLELVAISVVLLLTATLTTSVTLP